MSSDFRIVGVEWQYMLEALGETCIGTKQDREGIRHHSHGFVRTSIFPNGWKTHKVPEDYLVKNCTPQLFTISPV